MRIRASIPSIAPFVIRRLGLGSSKVSLASSVSVLVDFENFSEGYIVGKSVEEPAGTE